jgi:hypothetical protein
MEYRYKKAEIKKFLKDSIKNYSKDELQRLIRDGELHNEIFNTGNDTTAYVDYRGEGAKWMGEEAFEIIGIVKDYEQDNFGEVTTDLSDDVAVTNMYVYIVGEELIYEDPKLHD